jgi:hypothetical protein
VLRALKHRRLVQTVALVMQLCMAWLSESALLHNGDDDALCNPVLVVHDHNAHRIGASTGVDTQPDHCFICHNLSLRSLVASGNTATPVPAVHSVVLTQDLPVGVVLVAGRPARAPPAA